MWSAPRTDDLQAQKQWSKTHAYAKATLAVLIYRIQNEVTHCRCSRAEPPCALSPGCRRVSNAARRAATGACVPAGGPEEGRHAAACAFCVSLDSSETKPAKSKTSTKLNEVKPLLPFHMQQVTNRFFFFYPLKSDSEKSLTCMTRLLSPVMSASFCSVCASGLLSCAN